MVVEALVHGLPELLDLVYVDERFLISFALRSIRRHRVLVLQHGRQLVLYLPLRAFL